MALTPIRPPPGICKVNSPYASGKVGSALSPLAGRYIDGDHVRFVAGYPEKIGGDVLATPAQMQGIPRAMADFRDKNAVANLGIGTDSDLYVFAQGKLTDVTPLRTISTGTLTNAITTTAGSTAVNIADASQHLINGDTVFLSAASAVGGIQLNGWYPVSARSGTGYTITNPFPAFGAPGPGGGIINFKYPRRLMANNPFSTVSDSSIVTVTDTTHGAATGNYALFNGATPVAGLTIDGEYQVTVLTINTYTIDAGAPANATTTGGGAAVTVAYEVGVPVAGTSGGSPFGLGPFGVGPFAKRFDDPNSTFAGWTLAAYGATLLAAPIGGTIYIYDPAGGNRAYPVLNAPAKVLAMFVTPERFVFALGINDNPMQIAWPDQNDITNWTTLPTNTANSGRSFQGGTLFVAGKPVANGVSLFFSNRSTFQAAYTGDNVVYSTPLISDQSGLIGPHAVTTHGGIAYWMSDHDFWEWNGTVQPMMSDDIRDYVFRNINTDRQWICVAGTNRAKKEVWFFYPSASSNEIDSYVIAHLDQPGVWSVGTFQHPAWLDSDLLASPFASDASGFLYKKETTSNHNGAPIDSYIEFSPVDISNGDRSMDVFGFIPDFERLVGSVALTIKVQAYPQDMPQIIGPFTITPDGNTSLLDFRTEGKMVGYRLESNELNGDFRFGVPRANVQPGGARL